jgi:crossover junction endodeoxyribonuclease RuvC
VKILCQCYARSGRGGINAVVSARAIRILGIDPGLRRTGWGMIELGGRELGFLACGRIETNERESLARRLVTIHAGLAQVIAQFKPQEAAAEATFVNKDASATLKLGQARGVAILAAAAAGLPVAEYAPNLVKKTIVGAGHGEKAQIRMMVGVLLPRADPATEDAADALAIAITHAHHRSAELARAQSEARRQAKAGESDKIAAKLGRGFFP